MSLETFVVRLIIVVGLIWLTQFVVQLFKVRPPVGEIITGVVALLLLIFLVSGAFFPVLR